MSANDTEPDASQKGAGPGLIVKTMRRWFMRSATLAKIENLTPRFRLITVQGDALKDVSWSAGQKVQTAIGAGRTMRTYTPFGWDAAAGTVRFLAFIHGAGPGSRWAEELKEGATVEFLGPRTSIDLASLGAPIVLFGDETSFAIAAAARAASPGQQTTFVFEAGDAAEARAVLAALGIANATVIARASDDAHLAEAAAQMTRHITGDFCFVLTGRAPSIQHVSRALKAAGVASARIRAKAYWAPGKAGLD